MGRQHAVREITSTADGKRTRFGIDEHWHPELTNCLFYSSMGKVAALEIARGIYELRYCQPLCIAEIVSQEVANKLLSLGVNVGVVPAARMLQDAVTVGGMDGLVPDFACVGFGGSGGGGGAVKG